MKSQNRAIPLLFKPKPLLRVAPSNVKAAITPVNAGKPERNVLH